MISSLDLPLPLLGDFEPPFDEDFLSLDFFWESLADLAGFFEPCPPELSSNGGKEGSPAESSWELDFDWDESLCFVECDDALLPPEPW